MALGNDTLARLREIVGAENVLTTKEDLIPYSFDGTAAMQQMPGCIVFAKTTQQVAEILKASAFTNIEVKIDLSGIARFPFAKRPED